MIHLKVNDTNIFWSILTGQTISVSVVHKLIHAVKATTTHVTVVLRWRVHRDHDLVHFIFKHNFLVITVICKNYIKVKKNYLKKIIINLQNSNAKNIRVLTRVMGDNSYLWYILFSNIFSKTG